MSLFLFALLTAAQAGDPPALDSRLDPVLEAVRAHRPADAVALADTVIKDLEPRSHRTKDHCVFSAQSMGEVLLYAALSKKMGCTSSVVNGDDSLAQAYFLKGFALYDLGRMDDARQAYGQALSLAPLRPAFHLESAEIYKSQHQWPKAFDEFEQAATDTVLVDGEDQAAKASHLARAYRGMAFVKVEQHDYKAAHGFLDQALAAKPDDERTKSDLADLASRERR